MLEYYNKMVYLKRVRQFRLRTFQFILILLGLLFFVFYLLHSEPDNMDLAIEDDRDDLEDDSEVDPRSMLPFVFIGGMPRSGTTLLRVMLDSHPSIRCGPETHLIPKVLFIHSQYQRPYEQTRIKMGGISNKIFDSAIAAFILEILIRHDQSAMIYCNKDPMVMLKANYVKKLFPNSKFIFLIRDGRAVVNSIVSRKVYINSFNLSNIEQMFVKWNNIIEKMNDECISLGRSCFRLHYEQLVLNPEYWLRKLLRFIKVPWDQSVLHHEQFISNGAIKLSLMERSTDQVIKPINLESLNSWAKKLPKLILKNMTKLAPMLKVLGYDPNQIPPNYGQAVEFVNNNSRMIQLNRKNWKKKEKFIIKNRETLRRELNALEDRFYIEPEDLNI